MLEQDVPAFEEAKSTLLGGGVVAAGSGQDAPVQLVGDPLVLQLPDVGAVPSDPFFGRVEGDARVVLLFGGGQGARLAVVGLGGGKVAVTLAL